MRQIKDGEHWEAPVSLTNRNTSPLYVGRAGNARWQIAGFKATKSIAPDAESPDPYATMSDGVRMVLNEVLALGPQQIRRGSAIWQGEDFKIRASEFLRQLDQNVPEFFPGRITVSNGLVVAMEIRTFGMYRYAYNHSETLPPGIPSEIWAVAKMASGRPSIALRSCASQKP